MLFITVDLEIKWTINTFCNFSCAHCFYRGQKRDVDRPHNISQVLESIDRLDKTCLIKITGGEPFFTNNFVELCEKLTQKHIIGLNTNLSHKDVSRFAEVIDPKKVSNINCSLHIPERERLNLVEDYIKKYKLLEAKGFNVFAVYVLHPEVLDRFEDDYNFFKSHGIILTPKVFRGNWNKSEKFDTRFIKRIKRAFNTYYPNAYTKKQKEKIISYIEQSQKDLTPLSNSKPDELKARIWDLTYEKSLINDSPTFKGKTCLAGKSFIKITSAGEAFRCSKRHYLGNLFTGQVELFKKPMKCSYKSCHCPYLGYYYSY